MGICNAAPKHSLQLLAGNLAYQAPSCVTFILCRLTLDLLRFAHHAKFSQWASIMVLFTIWSTPTMPLHSDILSVVTVTAGFVQHSSKWCSVVQVAEVVAEVLLQAQTDVLVEVAADPDSLSQNVDSAVAQACVIPLPCYNLACNWTLCLDAARSLQELPLCAWRSGLFSLVLTPHDWPSWAGRWLQTPSPLWRDCL